VPLDEDDFEVLPGHLADAAAGGEEAAQGCAVCKDGMARAGELDRRLEIHGAGS